AAYPTFKKKGRHDSFSLTNDPFTVKGRKVHIPKLGWVRMHEPLRFVGKVVAGTISRTADRGFLSVTVEIPDPPVVRRENQAVVGVGDPLDRREGCGTESLCDGFETTPPVIATLQPPDGSR
ncbi:MAG: hypothetical protein OWU33_03685, partial [Firmicutes bacterium]|nr:hypothetical protein [Bacillota bacterium]